MSLKKLLLFFVALIQAAIVGVTVFFVMNGNGPEIFVYLEVGFVGLCLLCALLAGLAFSFGGLFFAFGGFIHIILTLASFAATGYFLIARPDDIMLIIFLGACSLVMLVSLIPILCAKR